MTQHYIKIKLNIDKHHPPKAQPQRRIPFHAQAEARHASEELQQQDIIERVPEDQPTPLVAPYIVVLTRALLKRLSNEFDILYRLSKTLVFLKVFLQAKSFAYNQLELDEVSGCITTFSAHIGLFRYKRLNYGRNAAAEIFQYTQQTQLQCYSG